MPSLTAPHACGAAGGDSNISPLAAAAVMESKKGLSALMEDDSFTMATALPPFARPQSPAPSGRFNLRRSVYSTRSSTSDASSSSSASTSSAASAAGSQTSCVARETSKYECSRHRFIVWAAVNRNTCERMTDDEKRECPLLRCTKRFPDHESMLRHLADCEYLPFAEYWCFTHSRVERFDDSKCKRCIGPGGSKRKKMLSMAKSFFSSLGHKHKKGSAFDLGAGDSLSVLPPPYEEISPRELHFELSSTEIVELDSTEVVVPQVSHASINPQDLLLPELDSDVATMNPLMDWQPSPLISEPSLAAPEDQLPARGKPFLQLHTQGLELHKAPRPRPVVPPVARSKNLSPSSSVRSTTSTMSNISSIISPVSVWSHGSNTWSSGLETNLTSPTTDGELLPEGAFGEETGLCNYQGPCDLTHAMFSELPADVPCQQATDLTTDPLLFPFDSSLSNEVLSYDTNVVLTEESADVLALGQLPAEEPIACYSETKALVAATWDLLLAHIADSLTKVQNMTANSLANELRLLTPKAIAGKGFHALRAALDGYNPTSALDTLCLVHLVYAMTIATYGGEALAQGRKLFAQTLAYAQYFPPADREPFTRMAVAIWLPADITQAELNHQMQLQYASMQAPHQYKGKQAQTGLDRSDPLTCAARNFLDELEMSAILGHPVSSLEVLTSNLFTKHFQQTGRTTANLPFHVTVNFILTELIQSFSDADGLAGKLRGLHQRMLAGSVQTVRRAELELLQAGKASMSPATFFDKFVPRVRSLCGQLYAQHEAPDCQRSMFNADTIVLMESLIDDICPDATNTIDASLEDFLYDFTNNFGNDLEPLLPSSTIKPDVADNSSGIDTTITDGSQATASRSSSAAAPSDGQPSGSKVEAYDCCDLCGYRPKGDPQWFRGSMAKHKKLQHSTAPPKIYKCPFPGCNSQYKNRPDNLRQHQIEKNHWVGQEAAAKKPRRQQQQQQHEQEKSLEASPWRPGEETTLRPSKRKKVSD